MKFAGLEHFRPTLVAAPLTIGEVGGGSQRGTRSVGITGADVVDTTAGATRSFPGNVTAGSMLIVAGAGEQGNGTVVISDTIGTPYTVVVFGTDFYTFIAYGIAPSSGPNTVSVNPALGTPGPFDSFSFSIDEFSGVTLLDVNGGSNSGAGTVAAEALTTTAPALIIGVTTFVHYSDQPCVPGSGYTQFGQMSNNTTAHAHAAVFRVENIPGAQVVQWQYFNGLNWLTQSIAFKA